MGDSIEDFDKLFERQGGAGNTWYSRLPDEAREFIDALTVRAVEKQEVPNSNAVRRILDERWGFSVTRNPIMEHFKKAIADA